MNKISMAMAMSLWRVMIDIASSKTERYVIATLKKDMAEGEQVPEKIKDIVSTFNAIMSKRTKTSQIEAEGDRYQVTDYQFPEAFWQLARARRVFVTPDSIEHSTPYWEAESAEGNLVSPERINRFFEQFNSNQTDGSKIVLSGPTDDFNNPVSLSDFKALVTSNGRMCSWNVTTGTLDDMVAQILGITAPVSEEYLYTWEQYDERSVDKWLTSVK